MIHLHKKMQMSSCINLTSTESSTQRCGSAISETLREKTGLDLTERPPYRKVNHQRRNKDNDKTRSNNKK